MEQNNSNHIVKVILIVLGLAVLGYGAYQAYLWAIADATKKIRAGVSEGVQDGVGKSLNPIGMVGNIFGGKK